MRHVPVTIKCQPTRRIVKVLRVLFEKYPPETCVCIGKSLGATRMFRALDRLGVTPKAIVSIDPLSTPRMFFPMDVKPSARLARVTTNIYQTNDPALRGVRVRGAENKQLWLSRKRVVSHSNIIYSVAVELAIEEALG